MSIEVILHQSNVLCVRINLINQEAYHLGVVAALTPKDFYKSMTTHDDHRVWQDVYRPMTSAGKVYLKLTVWTTC